MALDFVLAHSNKRFLETELDKVHHLTSVLGIAESTLPVRIYGPRLRNSRRNFPSVAPTKRYFVEKYPIFLSGRCDQDIAFCFVDEGLVTSSHFQTFLERDEPLFSALQSFNLIYIAARPTPFRWVSTVFDKHVARWSSVAATADPLAERLGRYFFLRQKYEAQDFTDVDRAKLLELRSGQSEFSEPQYTTGYEAWKSRGEGILSQHPRPETTAGRSLHPSFSTFLLEYNYDFLGTLTAI